MGEGALSLPRDWKKFRQQYRGKENTGLFLPQFVLIIISIRCKNVQELLRSKKTMSTKFSVEKSIGRGPTSTAMNEEEPNFFFDSASKIKFERRGSEGLLIQSRLFFFKNFSQLPDLSAAAFSKGRRKSAKSAKKLNGFHLWRKRRRSWAHYATFKLKSSPASSKMVIEARKTSRSKLRPQRKLAPATGSEVSYRFYQSFCS